MTVTEMRKRAVEAVKGLPENRLRSALDYLEYLQTRKDIADAEYDIEDLTASIKRGLEELAMHKAGKLNIKSGREFLSELRG